MFNINAVNTLCKDCTTAVGHYRPQTYSPIVAILDEYILLCTEKKVNKEIQRPYLYFCDQTFTALCDFIICILNLQHLNQFSWKEMCLFHLAFWVNVTTNRLK